MTAQHRDEIDEATDEIVALAERLPKNDPSHVSDFIIVSTMLISRMLCDLNRIADALENGRREQ